MNILEYMYTSADEYLMHGNRAMFKPCIQMVRGARTLLAHFGFTPFQTCAHCLFSSRVVKMCLDRGVA
jgi:hypothetical protein